MSGIIVVFDFDKTIVDCDSDNWVVDELGFTDLFNQLLPTMPWNSLMDRMMMELHSQGVTIEEIEEVLKRIPIHPRVVPAIKAAHALGCDLRVVSDANMFFIETILKHLGIKDCFSEINTNPGYVNGEGRLRILPYHDFNKAPHGCGLCPPNMCKGLIIERIQDSISPEGSKRFIYLGDGAGDYCPSLRLKERDCVMPRKNFPVWDLICKDPLLVKAKIHEWSDGEDLERVLIHLINKISKEEEEEASQFISPDCKLQILSVSAPESRPRPLRVQQSTMRWSGSGGCVQISGRCGWNPSSKRWSSPHWLLQRFPGPQARRRSPTIMQGCRPITVPKMCLVVNMPIKLFSFMG